MKCAIPTTKGRTKVKRHRVAVAASSAIWSARDDGAFEREIIGEIARKTGESEANARKLLAESEHASFLQSEVERLKAMKPRAALPAAKRKTPRVKPEAWS